MAITIEHDGMRRNGRVIVHSARLTFEIGARVGLIGLNGAGKSTWLHGLTNLIPGTTAVVTSGERVLPYASFTSQHPSLPAWLSVGEAIEILVVPYSRREALCSRWRIEDLLSCRAGQLSKGEAQFIAAIIALESDNTLRCLDEPFSALDLKRRRELINGISDPTASASSVTIVTAQVASDLFESCTEILMLRNGELSTLGSVQALAAGDGRDPRDAFERRIVAALTHESLPTR